MELSHKQIAVLSVCAILLLLVFSEQGICQDNVLAVPGVTAGTLRYNPDDGETYIILFTGAVTAEKIRQYIKKGALKEGVAEPLSTEMVRRNPIMRASILAFAAARECENAKKRFLKGEITEKERDWICAKAQQMLAREAIASMSEIIKGNPDLKVVEWATEQKLAAVELEKIAIEGGALQVPTPEAYEAPEIPVLATPVALTPLVPIASEQQWELVTSPSTPTFKP